MVLPPARHPARIESAASRNSSGLGVQSASTKKIQSPRARAAPALRARPIWLTGSNTTPAPARFATCAVRSVELLSHTMSSDSQPTRANPSMAARLLESEPGSNRSSLNAGTTTEIFISLAPISAYYSYGGRELDRGPDAKHNPPAGLDSGLIHPSAAPITRRRKCPQADSYWVWYSPCSPPAPWRRNAPPTGRRSA